jgi:oligopeptide/dipeptide ABC transporter ATP-binding protein
MLERAGDMDEIILSTRQLMKVYRGRRGHAPVRALQGVDIELAAGRTLGIVGESGCGKSTLAKLLVGLETPTSGSITLAGTELGPRTSPEPRALARLIQMVFQDPHSSLNPRLTVEQTISEVLAVHELAARQLQPARVVELLELVALPARFAVRYPHELSGGQAQRVAIARALAAEPRILVLDEPTSALDVSVRAEVMNLLIRLQDEFQLTYVFVSHDLGMVRHISDQIAVMYLGRVVEEGPHQEVFDAPLHPYTHALAAAVPLPDPELAQSADEVREVMKTSVTVAPVAETGCAYQPRCPLAVEICSTIRPRLLTLRPDHTAACHVAAAQAGLEPQDADAEQIR